MLNHKVGRLLHSSLSISLIARIVLALFCTLGSVTLAWFFIGGTSFHNARAATPTIREIFTPPSDPWGIAFDNHQKLWLSIPNCDPTPICISGAQIGSIAEYDRTGFAYLNTFTEPAGFSSPVFLALDASGNIWFTEPMTNAIGELIPNLSNPNNSTWNQWTVPTSNAGPFDLAFDLSGNLWFTEITANAIGEFNPSSGQFVGETPTPSAASKPYGIIGPDSTSGSMWFTENNSSVARIGSFVPPPSGALKQSAIHEYKTNSGSTSTTPHLITFDNQGNIWWSEGFDGDIGRLIISQAVDGTNKGVSEFHVPGCANQMGTPGPCPNGSHISGIGVDSTGTVWFDDSNAARVGSFVPGSNTFTMYYTPTANSHSHDGLAVDGNNNVWFAEEFANQLGEVVQNGIPNPTPGPTGTVVPRPSPTATPPPNNQPVSKSWYFAEGRIGAGFREYLTLENPDPLNDCAVDLTYLYKLDTGNPTSATLHVTVPHASRVTQSVNADLNIASSQTPAASVANTVFVNNGTTPLCQGIVAERPMYYNAFGITSGSDVLGATHLATTFNFADVPTGGGYLSFITILNPGGTQANVTATYYSNGNVVGTQPLAVAGGTRDTLAPPAGLPQHVAAVVSSDQPIVVERPDYFKDINAGSPGTISGGTDIVGAPTLANDWLFAEGFTGNSHAQYQENLVIANLDASNTAATVTINLEYTNGVSNAFQLIVGPKSQVIWNVNAQPNAGSPEVSAEVKSTGANIVVERQLFFRYNHLVNNITTVAIGGTDVVGQVGPIMQHTYNFAEGYTNAGYNEWLTLQNPTGNTETITLTLVNGYGVTYSPPAFSVTAHSRFTVDITAVVVQHMVQPGNDHRGYEVSMSVQSNNVPFVAERPMYWNTFLPGSSFPTQGGSDVIGYMGA